MSEARTGGPAFPHTVIGDLGQTREVVEGVSVRDYFAAKALQGLIAEPVPREKDGETAVTSILRHAGKGNITSPQSAFAYCAYVMADAMLRERAK